MGGPPRNLRECPHTCGVAFGAFGCSYIHNRVVAQSVFGAVVTLRARDSRSPRCPRRRNGRASPQ
eukprot:5518275-Prymnesium_polylepis.1